MKKEISEYLQEVNFYIGNKDGEFCEKSFYRVVEEIYFDFMESDRKNLKLFIREYVAQFYPYNI